MSENNSPSHEKSAPFGRLAAWIGGLGAVAVALVGLLASVGDLLDLASRLHDRLAGRAEPPAASAALPAPLRPGAGVGTYVREGHAPEAAWLAARLRRTLELEGVQVTAQADHARSIVAISPPRFEAVEPAPAGAPMPFGARILLEARILAGDDEAHPLAVVQREARGLGATPAEATERARQAAADLLGRRLAETLQSN
ncbi:hypothetical protein [Paracraurococcus lichenis]|uniref:DUF4136 domain-containing protein n=1 Tax=Paracraurococcus lichenis TaxID=3064888 RepID=A0ABT9E089_9PROT|nr:hypothetical protein [Paracraurococcus sp. LOR1-02]MDO9709542.1 hypothetical protein [Paracraurococcus sp. LOR1-02]